MTIQQHVSVAATADPKQILRGNRLKIFSSIVQEATMEPVLTADIAQSKRTAHQEFFAAILRATQILPT